MRSLRRRDASSIHVFWSWFGAGKTHALYYIQNLALRPQDAGAPMITVYSEFPKGPSSFLDLYRAFIGGLDEELLSETYLELATGSGLALKRLKLAAPDLHSAMYVVATGSDTTRLLALRWLRGDSISAAECRLVGVPRRLISSEDAVRVFSALVSSLVASRASATDSIYPRVLWMIDEYQRIANSPPRVLRTINDGLHSAFNACPGGLSLFLSFSGKPQSSLPPWFSPELRDRIGLTKVMILPPMSRKEGMDFVRDLLAHYRTGEASDLFPFDEGACLQVLSWLESQGEIKPRGIMQAFGAVLDEADPLIDNGELAVVDAPFAARVLAQHISLYEADR